MNRHWARALVQFYPAAWKQRYGEEFRSFLEADTGGILTSINVIWAALREQALQDGGLTMNKSERALGLSVGSFLVMVAAGMNFYGTVDDSPLVGVMRSHNGMSFSWAIIEIGSIMALIGASAIGLPLVFGMARSAWKHRRYDMLRRLLFPVCAAGALVLWGGVVGLLYSHGKWVPSPWAVTGDWVAPAAWPSLTARWFFGFVTVLLAAIFLIGSPISLQQVLRRADIADPSFSRLGRSVMQRGGVTRIAAGVVALSAVAMSLAVLSWGLIAQASAPTIFNSHFGVLNSTAIVSWVLSLSLFTISSALAVRGYRNLTNLTE